MRFLLSRVVVFSKIADKSVFPLLVLSWTLKLWCAKTVRKTVPILSSPNLTFLKIMPNVFSDTFQLIQAERYFLSFDLSVYWPEEYSYSPRESYDTRKLNHRVQVLSISVWKWRQKKPVHENVTSSYNEFCLKWISCSHIFLPIWSNWNTSRLYSN